MLSDWGRPLHRLAAAAVISGILLSACGAASDQPGQAPGRTGAPQGQPGGAALPGASGTSAGSFPGEAKSLTGAGATFPAVLYTKWFNEYAKLTGVQVNYQSIGSGGGIKSVSDQTVDFGASDAPLTDDQLKAAKGGELLHIPTALGAVVVTYNLPGLSQSLKLNGDTVAGIYLGNIKKWNEPALVADNPFLAQVDKSIVVIHRSDGSGTTNIFTDYLGAVSPAWKSRVGTGTSVNWPVGLGAKGNEGVSGEVKQTAYSIGYVELIYALQNKLGVGLVKNRAGSFVEPKIDTVSAAAAGIADSIAADLRASIVNADGKDAYPISGFTYQLVYANITDKAKAIAISRLLWWEIHEGQHFNSALGYAPLPEGIVKKAEDKILSISSGGERAFPGR